VAIPDADVIIGALRLADIEFSEKAIRAAVQDARRLARWPLDEPAAIFFAFARRPRAAPALGAKLATFLMREQLEPLGLQLAATDEELKELRMRILTQQYGEGDVLDWFAQRFPAD
jgi:hypothetical protein